ncbi:hypothetical protein ACSBR2_008764 [Camellia fascicularis]
MIGSGLVESVDNVFERRLERERLVYRHLVGEGQPRTTGGSTIGEDEGDELRRERELSSSEDLELRKESNWSRVGDLEPAVIKLKTTWMERGEKTRFESKMGFELVVEIDEREREE